MMRPTVIAVCGLKRSGKDTVADYLASKYGYGNVKFAAPLKNALMVLFGFTSDQLENKKDVTDPKWQISPRTALQFFGTEIMQYEIQKIMPHMQKKFFAKRLCQDFPNGNIVISDMRFLHEYHEVRKSFTDFMVIKVTRDNLSAMPQDTHISEMEYSKIPCDVEIVNNGSIEQLYKQVDDFMCSMLV